MNATEKRDNDEQFYRDTESIAFPKLDDRQLARWSRWASGVSGAARSLTEPGQRDFALTVVLSGELEVLRTTRWAGADSGHPGPRDFVGDVAMLNGTSALASARGKAEDPRF